MTRRLHVLLVLTLGSSALVVALMAGITGCSEEEPGPTDPALTSQDQQDQDEQRAMGRAKRAAKQLGTTLKGRLGDAMEQGGPPRAMEVCADEAQRLGAAVAEETGVRVGRSSLKLRNPDNAGPDWVRAWLEEQGDRPAADIEPAARVEEGEARFIAPIAVEGLCVSCHGPREALPAEVRQVLSERYPQDEAVGYAPGDLRGAIWAATPLSE